MKQVIKLSVVSLLAATMITPSYAETFSFFDDIHTSSKNSSIHKHSRFTIDFMQNADLRSLEIKMPLYRSFHDALFRKYPMEAIIKKAFNATNKLSGELTIVSAVVDIKKNGKATKQEVLDIKLGVRDNGERDIIVDLGADVRGPQRFQKCTEVLDPSKRAPSAAFVYDFAKQTFVPWTPKAVTKAVTPTKSKVVTKAPPTKSESVQVEKDRIAKAKLLQANKLKAAQAEKDRIAKAKLLQVTKAKAAQAEKNRLAKAKLLQVTKAKAVQAEKDRIAKAKLLQDAKLKNKPLDRKALLRKAIDDLKKSPPKKNTIKKFFKRLNPFR